MTGTTITPNGVSYVVPDDLTQNNGAGHSEIVTAGTGESLPRLFAIMADYLASSAKQMRTTSTSSVAIGTGAKTFVLAVDTPFLAGERGVAIDTANAANYMYFTVTSYTSSTKTLITSVASGDTGGSGTIASWYIAATGQKGDTGATGAAGANGYEWASTTSGTSSAYTATFTPTIASYTAGQPLVFKVHTNCAAGATLNANGIGAKNIYINGAAVAVNALVSGVTYLGIYDGTNIQIIGAVSGGISDTLVTPVVGAGSSQSLNYASGNVFDLTGTASTACTLTFSNLPSSGTFARFRLIWRQDAVTGGATLTWPASVKWLGRSPQTSAPTFSTAASFVHEVQLWTDDGGTTVWANLVGGSTVAVPSSTAGTYVAVCSNGYTLYGTDGASFTKSAQQLSGLHLKKIINHGGRFQIGTNDGTARDMSLLGMYTTNGSSFTAWPASASDNMKLRNILYTTGSILAYGQDASNNVSWKSIDDMTSISSSGVSVGGGGDFSIHATDGGEGVLILDVGGTGFCAATNLTSGGLVVSSGNHTGMTTAPTGCFYGNGNWIVLANNGTIGYKATPNGTALTSVASVVGAVALRYGLWTGTKWIAAGDSGKLCNSSSIGTWTSRTTGLSGNITSIANNGSVIMVVTDIGEIARSTDDGDTWTVLSSGNPFGGSALTFIKRRLTQFWTGGAGQKIAASSDNGLTFTLVSTGSGSETIYDFEAV